MRWREEYGSCPFVEWFDKLRVKVQGKCYLRLERLREMGHELRRPEANFLRVGIYELRASLGGTMPHNKAKTLKPTSRWRSFTAGSTKANRPG